MCEQPGSVSSAFLLLVTNVLCAGSILNCERSFSNHLTGSGADDVGAEDLVGLGLDEVLDEAPVTVSGVPCVCFRAAHGACASACVYGSAAVPPWNSLGDGWTKVGHRSKNHRDNRNNTALCRSRCQPPRHFATTLRNSASQQCFALLLALLTPSPGWSWHASWRRRGTCRPCT